MIGQMWRAGVLVRGMVLVAAMLACGGITAHASGWQAQEPKKDEKKEEKKEEKKGLTLKSDRKVEFTTDEAAAGRPVHAAHRRRAGHAPSGERFVAQRRRGHGV
jgi:hypothetical protein